MDTITHLCRRRYHHVFQCPRTGDRVSYALIGSAWDRSGESNGDGDVTDVILFLLPAGCTRYIAIPAEKMCDEENVRIVAMDRPGCGATTMCPLSERLSRCSQHILSLLDLLQPRCRSGRPLKLLSHSAGFLYAMQLLSSTPPEKLVELFGREPRYLASSAFVPTNISGSSLSYLPRSLVAIAPTAMPFMIDAFSAISTGATTLLTSSTLAATTFASGFRSKSRDEEEEEREAAAAAERKAERKTAKSMKKKPDAEFWPPYPPISLVETSFEDDEDQLGEEGSAKASEVALHPATGKPLTEKDSIMFDMMRAEEAFVGFTQDYLLCLGKEPSMDNGGLERLTREAIKGLATLDTFDRTHVKVLWGDQDGITPKKGRDWLDGVFDQAVALQGSKLDVSAWIMAEAGHDQTITTKAVMKRGIRWLLDIDD